MATTIHNKAGIRDTFEARPDLQEVHVLPNGAHYFTRGHAEEVLGKGEVLVTLRPDSEELKDDEKPTKK